MSYRARTRAVDASGIIGAQRLGVFDPAAGNIAAMVPSATYYTTGSSTPSSSYNVAQVLGNK